MMSLPCMSSATSSSRILKSIQHLHLYPRNDHLYANQGKAGTDKIVDPESFGGPALHAQYQA